MNVKKLCFVLIKNLFHYIFFFVIIFINHHQALARWANYEDASKEVYSEHDIKVNADGSYEQEINLRFKVITESAREESVNYYLNYNDTSEKLIVLEAKTINHGKEYIVPEGNIEDKPLASALQGFDQGRQILISFPNVDIGSEICIKYKILNSKVILPNHYSFYTMFGKQGYYKHHKITINSAIPLHIKSNDPDKVLNIQHKKVKDRDKITIKLNRDYIKDVVNESSNSIVSSKYATYVDISSIKEWSHLASLISKPYIRVMHQELPDLYQQIYQIAQKQDNEVAQINTVTSMLNNKIRYMGDWRSVEGRYIPHDLAQIVQNHLGDCKDFSASAAAILHQLGYKVQFALVWRDLVLPSYDIESLPSMGVFNHVMLKVIGKSGKVYWIDPTNNVSMADGLFPDISGKMVLLLDEKNGGYEQIPEVDINHNRITTDVELQYKDNAFTEKGRFVLEGEGAISLTGVELYASKQTIIDSLYANISETTLAAKEKKKLIFSDLKSRIVEPVQIEYEYVYPNMTVFTNMGKALRLKGNWHRPFLNIDVSQVGDQYIGVPYTMRKIWLIKGIKVQDVSLLNFDIQSKWLNAKREYNIQKDGNIKVEEIVVYRTKFVSNADLKTTEYKQLADKLDQYVEKGLMVFNPPYSMQSKL